MATSVTLSNFCITAQNSANPTGGGSYRSLLIAIAGALAVSGVLVAEPQWTGKGLSSEWGDGGNWTADKVNHYWFDAKNSPAAKYDITFSRDGRIYQDDGYNSEHKDDGLWDYYNVWELDICRMDGGETVTWTGIDALHGLNIRNGLYIGKNGSVRGALAIKSGRFTVGRVDCGYGSGKVGEFAVDGGRLEVSDSIRLGYEGAKFGALQVNGGVVSVPVVSGGTGNTSVILSGGTLEARSVAAGSGSTRRALFDGGTVKAASDGSFAFGNVTFAEGGLKFDTNGNSPALSFETAAGGGTLEKIGEGALSVNALAPGGSVAVAAGTLAVRRNNILLHRWSFNGNLSDSVGRQTASAVGDTSYTDGAKVKLSGGGHGTCYIDLGENVVPTDGTAFTVEIWGQSDATEMWKRYVTFGNRDGNDFANGFYIATFDDNKPGFVLFKDKSGKKEWSRGDNFDAMADGAEYLWVIRFSPTGPAHTDVTVMQYDASGKLLHSHTANAEWHPSCMEGSFYRLGYSGGGEGDAQTSFSEVRIWRGALSEAEIAAHASAGPDVLTAENANANTLPEEASGELRTGNYLAHRWSFNGDVKDSAGGADATLKGGAAFDFARTRVVLPGGSRGAGWVDLGERGIFPTNDTPFTIELWTTRRETVEDARIFSIGKRPDGTAGDSVASLSCGFFACYADGDSEGSWWYAGRRKDGGEVRCLCEKGLEKGREYHLAVTVIPGADGNTRVQTYTFDSNGLSTNMRTETFEGWTPSSVNKIDGVVCSWLGHSQWGNDDSKVDFDEVRIWNCALSEAQLLENNLLGPDVLPMLSAEAAQAAGALNLGSAVVASGATIDFAGDSATVENLSGAGTVANAVAVVVTGVMSPGGDGAAGMLTIDGDVAVTGTIRLDDGDRIVVDGSLDLSGATVEIVSPMLSGPFTFATATGGVTGSPAVSATGGWNRRCVVSVTGTEARIKRLGFTVKIR